MSEANRSEEPRSIPNSAPGIAHDAQPGFISRGPFLGVRLGGDPPQVPYPLRGGETVFAQTLREIRHNPGLVTDAFMCEFRESLRQAYSLYREGLSLPDRQVEEEFDTHWAGEKYGVPTTQPKQETGTFTIQRVDGNHCRTYPVEIYEDYKDEKYYHVFVITLAPGYTVTIRLNREEIPTNNPFELIGVRIHDTGAWADDDGRPRKEERNVDTDPWANRETEPDGESLAEVVAALTRVIEIVHEDVLSCAVEGVRYRTLTRLRDRFFKIIGYC